MAKVITLGEPMAMFVATELGSLAEAQHYAKSLAGSELNVSVGLRRLGHEVLYVTKLGDDPFGQSIDHFLQKEQIQRWPLGFDHRHPTGFQLKAKVVEGDPEVVYFRKHSAASYLTAEDVEMLSWEGVAHVHITGIPLALSQGCYEAVLALVAKAKVQKLPITFDPNLRPSLWPSSKKMIETVNQIAQSCDWVLPGLAEGQLLTGYKTPETIAKAYQDQGIYGVIVKLGQKGAYVAYDQQNFYVPGFAVEQVIDTVGAGDGFAAGVISGFLEGLSVFEAVRQGNALGAMQVQVSGDNEGLPSHSELQTFLVNHNVR